MNRKVGDNYYLIPELVVEHARTIEDLSTVFSRYSPLNFLQNRGHKLQNALSQLSTLLISAQSIHNATKQKEIIEISKKALNNLHPEDLEPLATQQNANLVQDKIEFLEQIQSALLTKETYRSPSEFFPQYITGLLEDINKVLLEPFSKKTEATFLVVEQILKETKTTKETEEQVNLLKEALILLSAFISIQKQINSFCTEALSELDHELHLQMALNEIQRALSLAIQIPHDDIKQTIARAIKPVIHKLQTSTDSYSSESISLLQSVNKKHVLLETLYQALNVKKHLKEGNIVAQNFISPYINKAILSHDAEEQTLIIDVLKELPSYTKKPHVHILFHNLILSRDLLVEKENLSTLSQQTRISVNTIPLLQDTFTKLLKLTAPPLEDSNKITVMRALGPLFSRVVRPLVAAYPELQLASTELHQNLKELSLYNKYAKIDYIKILSCSSHSCTIKNFKDPDFSVEISLEGMLFILEGRKDLKTGEAIAVGHFGRILFGEHPLTGDKIAVKLTFYDPEKSYQIVRIQQEATVLSLANKSPYLLGASFVGLRNESASNGVMVAVMEKMQGPTLCGLSPSSTAEEQKIFFRQLEDVALGLEYLHSQKIIHRDIKESNIMTDKPKGRARLLDFGLSATSGRITDRSGTANYMSPEALLGELQTTRSDIYSFGIMLYSLLTGFIPYELNTTQKERSKKHYKIRTTCSITVSQKAYECHNFPPQVNQKLEEVFNLCLKLDPNERMSVTDLAQALHETQSLLENNLAAFP